MSEEKLPKGPEWARKVFADTHGYFWLPCPICGRMSGGHEWIHNGTLAGEEHAASIPVIGRAGFGHGICPWCTVLDRAQYFAYDDVLGRAVPNV